MIRLSLPEPVRTQPPEAPPLGRDLAFDGQLHVGPDGDYRTVEGHEALRQSLLRRLVTDPGEYAFETEYGAGLKRSVKAAGSRSEAQRIRGRVMGQLQADDRVRSVPAVSVERIERGIRVRATVSTTGETVTLRPLEVTQ